MFEAQKKKITKRNKMRCACNNTHNTHWLIIRVSVQGRDVLVKVLFVS